MTKRRDRTTAEAKDKDKMNTRGLGNTAETDDRENGRFTERMLAKTERIRGNRKKHRKRKARTERIDETERRKDNINQKQRV